MKPQKNGRRFRKGEQFVFPWTYREYSIFGRWLLAVLGAVGVFLFLAQVKLLDASKINQPDEEKPQRSSRQNKVNGLVFMSEGMEGYEELTNLFEGQNPFPWRWSSTVGEDTKRDLKPFLKANRGTKIWVYNPPFEDLKPTEHPRISTLFGEEVSKLDRGAETVKPPLTEGAERSWQRVWLAEGEADDGFEKAWPQVQRVAGEAAVPEVGGWLFYVGLRKDGSVAFWGAADSIGRDASNELGEWLGSIKGSKHEDSDLRIGLVRVWATYQLKPKKEKDSA